MGIFSGFRKGSDVHKSDGRSAADSHDEVKTGRSQKNGMTGTEVQTRNKRIDVMSLERDIIIALRQVYDPEIPVNIYDLGLIYELKVDEEHNVYIQMTLTAPNCPMADYVVDQVRTAVEDVPGVVSATIDLVFEPVWDKSRMSEEALVELGLDPD